MVESRLARFGLRVVTAATLAFIYLPLLVIFLYAFNDKRSLVWPIDGLTTKWFGRAIDNPGVRDALFVSLKAALGEELGVEPSAQLRRLREQIVVGDEALAAESRTATVSGSGPAVRASSDTSPEHPPEHVAS